MECFGCFFPRKAARPAGQKQHISVGQGTLAIAPGHFLDDDCLTTAAIDATHGIKQKNQKAPKGNELETALGQLIVSGGRLMAARTNCRRTFARPHCNFNTLMIGAETGLLVNKPRKAVTAVENRDELKHEVEDREGENVQNKPCHYRGTPRP